MDDWMTDEHKAAALEGWLANPSAQEYARAVQREERMRADAAEVGRILAEMRGLRDDTILAAVPKRRPLCVHRWTDGANHTHECNRHRGDHGASSESLKEYPHRCRACGAETSREE
ncbi:hypothetical protein [Umezawaea tangerina]|uniref:Uncharacterized protein n=1 Tax=Umezawaea tangerina TaxID=84725 RepID=A0A2T0SPS4_9PSEU|nr:hypothetical protein [Umezawaea tangerina]PRY35363.1 hypothetical protein CLV43_114281 [Umezawaea tangerina]